MKKFHLVTETNSDMPAYFAAERDVYIIPMPFTIDGVDYTGAPDNTLPSKEFYDRMRAGSMPITAQVNAETVMAHLEPFMAAGEDILYLVFSSGLSGTINSVRLAAEELEAKYPGRRFVVVDTLCASQGETLLAHYVAKMRDDGVSIDEAAAWVEANRQRVNHWFTVDDLLHLHRGGRLSKTAAVMGTMMQVKPLLRINAEGKLLPVSKTRGRRHSLEKLVEIFLEHVGDTENEVFFISHGDCLEDAEFCSSLLARRSDVPVIINVVSPAVASHAGPGVLGIIGLGKERE